jgi:hypothetical protein
MSQSEPSFLKSHLAAGAARWICVLCLFPWILAAELGAQSQPKTKAPLGSPPENVRTQANRIETLAKQNIGAAVEILKELVKFAGGGEAALKAAATKTEAAMKRIQGDSASFDVELKKAQQQLESGREELKKLEGAPDIIAAYLVEKVDPLAENLRQSESVSRTSLAVLESTLKKINSWRKKYERLEEANGRNEAVAAIKILVEKEIAGLTKN